MGYGTFSGSLIVPYWVMFITSSLVHSLCLSSPRIKTHEKMGNCQPTYIGLIFVIFLMTEAGSILLGFVKFHH